jgi:hypothetical protein
MFLRPLFLTYFRRAESATLATFVRGEMMLCEVTASAPTALLVSQTVAVCDHSLKDFGHEDVKAQRFF